jgi:hypothetical protein
MSPKASPGRKTRIGTSGIDFENSPALQAEVQAASQPVESDRLAWIRSHALRELRPPPSTKRRHTARQIADQLGQAKVSITQDTYLGRRAVNPPPQPFNRPSKAPVPRRPVGLTSVIGKTLRRIDAHEMALFGTDEGRGSCRSRHR